MYVIKARTYECVRNDSEMHSTGVTGLHSRLGRSCNPVTQSQEMLMSDLWNDSYFFPLSVSLTPCFCLHRCRYSRCRCWVQGPRRRRGRLLVWWVQHRGKTYTVVSEVWCNVHCLAIVTHLIHFYIKFEDFCLIILISARRQTHFTNTGDDQVEAQLKCPGAG